MRRNSKIYRFTSTLVAMTMLLQLLAPMAAIVPSATAVQAAPPITEQLITNNEPFTIDNSPIAISRVQSSHRAGDVIVVDYTVTNNQLPTLDADVPASATITDTISILASFDITEDMNSLRNVVVADTILAGSFITSSLPVTQNGSTLSWTLPDIPPQGSVAISLTLQAPAASPDFTDLTSGAAVTANLWNDVVSANAPAANLIPDAVDAAYVTGSLSADPTDPEMLKQAAAFSQDPLTAFALAQSLDYEPYKGSLRGTRGTLWGEAGNSLDQSSLLIAMLRSGGIPARYRHGALSVADAQTLIAGMFDTPQGVAGYLPASANLADPVNDPDLIALVQDHWWVEAYLPGSGWTNLDPSFAAANAGDMFATPGANDQIAAVPANLHSTVDITVRQEEYNSFPIGGVFLSSDTVLTATFATAELAGKTVSLGHIVETESQGGMVYANTTHTYTPYLMFDAQDDVQTGSTFDDLLTNFPLASHFTTAEWITFEITDIDGNVETIERTVKDRIGEAVRLGGGSPVLSLGEDGPAFFQSPDLLSFAFMPHALKETVLDSTRSAQMPQLVALAQKIEATNALPAEDIPLTPEQTALIAQTAFAFHTFNARTHSVMIRDFAHSGDQLLNDLEMGLQVKMYYAQPRLVMMGTTVAEDATTAAYTMDLRRTAAEAIPYPGQEIGAEQVAQWIKGTIESELEGAAMDSLFTDETAVTTARIFDEMAAQGIAPILFTPDDLNLVSLYNFSSETEARLANALLTGYQILIPAEPVLLNGELLMGWWQIDPDTGETIGVLENGLHGALLEYAVMNHKRYKGLKRLFQTPVKLLYKYLEKHLVPALTGGAANSNIFPTNANVNLTLALPGSSANSPGNFAPLNGWRSLPGHLCPFEACGVEQFMRDDAVGDPMPLPELTFGYQNAATTSNRMQAIMTVISNGSPTAIQTIPASSTTTPDKAVNFDVLIDSPISDDFRVAAYAPEGWDASIDNSGSVTAQPAPGAPAGDYTIAIAAQPDSDRGTAVSTAHTVTITALEQLGFGVTVEPHITIPQNNALFAGNSNQTNDGEAEIPDSAYRIAINNESNSAKTYTVDVTGAPAGWIVLDGAAQSSSSVILPPGANTTMGLYIIPDALPAPGTSHTINVGISDGGALTDNAQIIWTMPGQAHNFMQVAPQTLYVTVDGSAPFELTMQNVGNNAGTFPLTVTTPISTWNVSGLPAAMTLAADETGTAVGSLNIVGGELGREYPLVFASAAPGSYTQYELATAVVVSQNTGAIFEAADSCTVGSDSLAAAFESLAVAVSDLELTCNAGTCDLTRRDVVVDAINSAANYALLASPFVTEHAALQTIAADLSGHSSNVDIEADLAALSTAVSTLSDELCVIEEHAPSAKFTPYVDAILLGENASFSLDVTNEGTIATTYAISVTGLPSGDQFFNESIAPGATINLPINETPAVLGVFNIAAEVSAVVPNADLTATAVARLNVVDKYVQITQVKANPDFVETGISSTDLSVEIANVSGVAQDGNARTAVFAPDGSTAWTQDIPLTALVGNPRFYDLATVDTSGWAEGTYTVTVDFLDAGDALIPDGSGYGYFNVGQALIASQAVAPERVAPGDVTVTTVITTEIITDPILSNPQSFANVAPGEITPFVEPQSDTADPPMTPLSAPAEDDNTESALTETTVDDGVLQNDPLSIRLTEAITISAGLNRYEETEPGIVYSGTWGVYNLGIYSGGSSLRSQEIGATAVFTFTGAWLEIGLNEASDAGKVEINIDGVSQGIFDLYGRNGVRPLIFPGLSVGQHVVTLTVIEQDNPFSSRNYVGLDYLTVWDGTAVPNGTFEHDDSRVIASNGWSTNNDANASSGTYGSRADKAWFYFMGDSITMQIVTSYLWDEMRVLVDGQFVTKYDLYQTPAPTDTLSLEGFGPGLHVLELDEYRGHSVLDTFTVPGIPPFDGPPPAASYTRYEEDDPAILYNELPFNDAPTTWTYESQGIASNRYVAWSSTLSDTASLTFNGTAVFLGFYTDDSGGLAQVSIDGVVQEIVDTYSNEADLLTRRYADLSPGQHTVTITILDDSNPFAIRNRVRLDFIDVWDGAALPAGVFEAEDRSNVYTSDDWDVISNAGASGGQYLERGSTLWFPFTGDSVSFVLPNDRFSQEMRLFVDDQFIDFLDAYSPSFITETISLNGWGPGAHLLRVENYRDRALADAFITPGLPPFWQPPDKSGFFRHEEDDTDLLFNGVPFWQAPNSWDRIDNIFSDPASGAQLARTSTANDTVSLTFNGEWVNLGFFADNRSGEIEIFIDGVSQGIFDLFRHNDDPVSFQFGDLGLGTHTVTAVNLGTSHPNSTGTRMTVDYIDTWDGTPLPQGLIEAEDGSRTYYSGDLGVFSEPGASGGSYVRDGLYRLGNMWFPFTGDSITLQAWSGDLDQMRIKIDGVEQPPLDIFNTNPQTRTVNFEGLGAGIHVLELNRYRDDFTADAFIVPAIPANFEYPPPAQTGIVRYEENDPALRYNGYAYNQTVGSWSQGFSFNISGDYVADSGTAGDNLTLDFYGSWFGVGFESTAQTGVAEIYLDGALLDTVDTSGNLGPMSVYFDVITGTHTISVTAVDRIRVDFIDTWDTTPMADGWYDADLNDRFGESHYTTYWGMYGDEYAREEDMVGRGLVNSRRTTWFAFTGNDLTFRSYNDDGGQYELFMDGVSQGVYTTTAVFSDQPLNWHFSDLDNGPHVFSLLAIDGVSRTYVDAFHVNPEKFVDAAPSVEWFDFTASSTFTETGRGIVSTIAVGDINQDGLVELVAPATNGQLYVYRGDGQDAGGGSPILWEATPGYGNEPAIADIDNDGYGEILLLAGDGFFAYEHDGATKWVREEIFSFGTDSRGSYGWGGVAVGNLDLDDEMELVVAPRIQQAAVVSADGQEVTRFGPTLSNFTVMPVLADINGDGILDIITADDDTLYVYDHFNGLNLIWSYTYDMSDVTPNTALQAWGAPAIANLDADDEPEIVMFFEEKVVALNHDGSELWVYKDDNANGYRPSHVTIADVDGDGELEIIVAHALSAGLIVLNHEIIVLNADGTLLWSELVSETTSSSSGVATHDLNGDGVWEVLWNGYGDGFLIFNGPDGDRIFNEPRINSGTIVDYPTVADVDGDNFAEIILGDPEGIWVVGYDDVWADSRPLWASTGYHITDINDDLSVPVNEQPSWLTHNTYRTQTPNRAPAPAYQVALTYTEGINNVMVLTDTASIPLAATPPDYAWSYHQEWYQPVMTTTFDSLLTAMQPGEVRQVSQGTEIAYALPSGINYLTLPPMYVAAPRIVTMSPAEATAAAGGTAVYDITLFNPSSVGDTYALSLAGIPDGWASFPTSVALAAGEEQTVQLSVAIPAEALPDTLPVIIDVTNGAGGADQAMASLTVFDGVDVAIAPDMQTAVPGETVTYTVTISNYESVQRDYALTATGLADVTLPPNVVVGPNDTATFAISALSSNAGPQPFTITAVGDNGATDSNDAILDIPDTAAVSLTLTPEPAAAGPGSTAELTAAVANLGSLPDSFDLSVTAPAGWTTELLKNGTAVSQVALPASIFNSNELTLLVTPDTGAAIGDYTVTVTAVSQTDPTITALAAATVQLAGRGVQVEILSGPATLDPRDVGIWDVRITNTGSVADTFDLQAAGLIAAAGLFSADSVTLNPGQSQTVQLTADNLDFVLPQTTNVIVAATAQGDPQIQDQDTIPVTFTGYEAVEVVWRPATQTVTDTLTAQFTLVFTNTGNLGTTYQLDVNGAGIVGSMALGQFDVPAHSSMTTLVTVAASAAGTYTFDGTASSTSSAAAASDTAAVTFAVSVVPNTDPVANDDSAATDEDTAVTIDVLFNDSDVDGDTLSVNAVTQGANGSVVNNGTDVTYTPNADFCGLDSFTYTISDGNGGSDTATVTVTVNCVNDDPVANDDSASTDEDTAVTIDVLFNDSDIDGDSLNVESVTQGANGSVVNNGADVTYTPSPGFNGSDSFTYTVNDGSGGTDTATVNVSVGAVNDDPVANDDDATTDEDTAVTIDVLFNDSDVDGDTLSVDAVTQGANGSVVNNGIDVTYTPDANFCGVDSFTYTVSDGNGGFATASVSVTINCVNDNPVANDDSASTDEDTAVTIDVLFNDSDIDGDSLNVESVTQGANGSVVNNGADVTYTPSPGFNGSDSFTYTVNDGNGGTDAATVNVSVGAVNDDPVANDDDAATDEDTAVTIDVLFNDSDVDGDALSVDSITQGANGSVVNNGIDVTYTPDANFCGVDSFTYTVSDGNGGFATASVSVTINCVNDNPVANDDSAATDEDTAVTIDVLFNDSDIDGDSLNVESVTQGANGSVVNNGADVTYTPNANFCGVDSFTYTVRDGSGGFDTAIVTITVNCVNDDPVANDDNASVNSGESVTILVLGNDFDVDGDTLTVTGTTDGTNGTTTTDGTAVTYTHNGSSTSPDNFTYTISDGNGGSATAVVAIDVINAGFEGTIYLSSNSRGFVGNVEYKDDDIIVYDPITDEWEMYFDGSDVGLKEGDVDAIHIMDDGSILVSFEQRVRVPDFGRVDDSDILKFIPTSLGEDTAGSFEWFLDGSDVGLRKAGEDVDAIGFAPDGRLVISTLATAKIPMTGGGQLQVGDEQLIVLNNAVFGADTAGDWEMYFDGRDVELRPEDIWGSWIDATTGDIYMSVQDAFSVPGVSGDGLDIFVCHPLSLGNDTACDYGPGLFFDGSETAFNGDIIDAFYIEKQGR